MSNGLFPSDEDLAVATLQVLAALPSGSSASIKEMKEGVAVRLDLPDEVFADLCSDGKTSEFVRRAGWARTYLKHMGAVRKANRRGRWLATDHGRSLAQEEAAVRHSFRKVRGQPTGTWYRK